MAGKPHMPEVERFMAKVNKAENGCWLWTAYRMKNGYGLFRTPERHVLAHRASYRLFCGTLDERDVMHACDTPACVNPTHLSLGTRKENMQDAKNKKRMRFGETHGRAKLTNAQVAWVKATNGVQQEMADFLGVSQSHISAIRSHKRQMGIAQEGNYYC